MVLYLGDMCERGTEAEWDYNYGRASYDDPGGGWKWGALAGWTQPTLGNREARNTPVDQNYWHGRPDWDTFVYGGVRYLNLNSECDRVGGCSVDSAQYEFVEQTLAANTQACIVTYWHRPVLSPGADDPVMRPIWKLLAENGGDLALTGHIHAMEVYGPLDGDLNAGQTDSTMWQIISGAGGHAMTSAVDTDPRNIWQKTKTPGALYLTNVGGNTGDATAINWVFRDVNGNAVFSGGERGSSTIDCGESGGPGDTQAPSKPGKPNGNSNAPGTVDLTWSASSDDRATTLTYFVCRDGGATAIGSVASGSQTTVTFRDIGLSDGSTHTYRVAASDGINVSPKSAKSNPISVVSGTPVIFSDDFRTGLGKWFRVVGASLDQSRGDHSGPPSVRTQAKARREYLRANLGGSYDAVCTATSVRVVSGSGSISLIRLRTAADKPIGRVFIKLGTNDLWLRSDVAGTTNRSRATVRRNRWLDLELCATTGTNGSYDLFLDGAPILSWSADNGTNPFGIIQLGDSSKKTYAANFDDVEVAEP